MAFIPLPYGIKLEFEYVKDGQICVNVMYAAKASPVVVITVDLQNAAEAALAWWLAIRGGIGNSVSISSITATDWSVPDGGTYAITSFPALQNVGGLGGTQPPNNVALVASLLTGKRGRSQRGRNYLVGVAGTDISGQNGVTLSFANTVAAAYQAMKTSLNADGLVPVVASFATNKAPRVTGAANALTQIRIDGVLDSQRRRLPGRGI